MLLGKKQDFTFETQKKAVNSDAAGGDPRLQPRQTGGPRLSSLSGGHAPAQGDQRGQGGWENQGGRCTQGTPPQASTILLIMLVRKPPEVKESTNGKMRRKSTTWKFRTRKRQCLRWKIQKTEERTDE